MRNASPATDRPASALPYLPGIDAMRAVAVLAVLAYHAEVSWMPGGFLGVDVFFVISGYLITALLMAEHSLRGSVDLGSFWRRRARRLLPAAFVMIGLSLAWAMAFLPDELASLRGDAIASFAYVTNWYLIFSEQSYFESFGRPSLFLHLWSLAIEEQFYLLWPVVFAAGIRLAGRRRLLWGVLAGIGASTALMWVLFTPGIDPSRLYYGTDTRVAGLLVGVALAMVWHPRRLRARVGPGAPLVLDAVGLVALLLLVRQLLTTSEFDAALYQGGFLRASLLTAVVLAVVAHPAARLGRLLSRSVSGVAPLLWVGHRSYSIYLWHWPVFMVTRPHQDIALDGWPLLVLRFALSLALGALSYRFVEQPIRHGALADWRQRLARAREEGAVPLQRMVLGATAAALSVALVAAAVVTAERPDEPDLFLGTEGVGLSVEARADGGNPSPAVSTSVAPATSAPTTTAVPTTTAAPRREPAAPAAMPPTPPPSTAPVTTAAPPPPVELPRTLALGDSVMLGAADALNQHFGDKVMVDAVVARPFDDGIWAARYYREETGLPDVVIVHLGNNGHFTPAQFDELMEVLADVRRVVFVTTRVNQRWQDEVNSHLVAGAERWPNARVADWKSLSHGHPEYFAADLTHLTPDGATVYAQFLAAQVAP
jgi:peptidoglycan/LPS O-acetylase OafA/YrhL